MRYFFSGKIEKLDGVHTIRIPFNVWEVCKQREVIQGDLVLDNKIISCELLPEEKGNSKIHLNEWISRKHIRFCSIYPAA